MRHFLSSFTRFVFAAFCILLWNGCENGGGSDHDFGDNDSSVAVAMGDSITALEGGNSTTYPAILGAMTGKTVVNAGSGGATSSAGAGSIAGILSGYKPGYVLILYGANDVISGTGLDNAVANLRSIIAAAKNNKTVPIVATLTPMYFEHEIFNGSAKALSTKIRQMASEEGCAVADLESAFGSNTSYFNDDGLHPNDSGLQVIADCFAGAM